VCRELPVKALPFRQQALQIALGADQWTIRGGRDALRATQKPDGDETPGHGGEDAGALERQPGLRQPAAEAPETPAVRATTCTCDPTRFKARDQAAHLDADLVRLPLTVATRKPGDRMRALGLKEPKRLQDILVDAHVPRQVRDSLPVVSDSVEIVWIPGVTVAESKRVTSATQRQLHLEIVHP